MICVIQIFCVGKNYFFFKWNNNSLNNSTAISFIIIAFNMFIYIGYWNTLNINDSNIINIENGMSEEVYKTNSKINIIDKLNF